MIFAIQTLQKEIERRKSFLKRRNERIKTFSFFTKDEKGFIEQRNEVFKAHTQEIKEAIRILVPQIKTKDLGLSKRAENALLFADADTIADIQEMGEMKLRRFRAMGEKSLEEIRSALKTHNVKLKK